MRILMYSWGKGKFKLQRIKWILGDESIWDEIKQYFVEENGEWFNSRMEEERVKANARHAKAVKANNARWSPPSNAPSNTTGNPQAYPPRLPTHNSELITHNLELIKSIVGFLNKQTGSSYRYTTPATQNVITARLRDGFSVEDIMLVVREKTREWGGDPKMSGFLRPVTLFGNKFEGYLQNATRSMPVRQDRQMRSTPE